MGTVCLQLVNMALFTHTHIAWLQSKISSWKVSPIVCARSAPSRLDSTRLWGRVESRYSGRLAHLIKAHTICTAREGYSFFFLSLSFFLSAYYVPCEWQICCLCMRLAIAPSCSQLPAACAFCGRSPRGVCCGWSLGPTFLNKDIFALITLLVGVFLCFVHFFGGFDEVSLIVRCIVSLCRCSSRWR